MLRSNLFFNSIRINPASGKSRPGRFITLLLAVVLSSASCAEQDSANTGAEPQPQESNSTMVTLKTSMGDIRIELDAEKAPASVENFLTYANDGYYDGTIFHRVIQNFMIQGGGFVPGLQKLATNAPIQNEANNGLKNDQYTIAMARTGEPHSATSQFFINTRNNDRLNHSSETNRGWGYAVFGKVVSGSDVVDAIEKVATTRQQGYGDVPVDDVVIVSVQVGPHP